MIPECIDPGEGDPSAGAGYIPLTCANQMPSCSTSGEHLINSVQFDPRKGHAAVLETCENPKRVTLDEVMELGQRVVSSTVAREEEVALGVHAGIPPADRRGCV